MHSTSCQDTLSAFENNCLEGKLTSGDPFEDSGVEPHAVEQTWHISRFCREVGAIGTFRSETPYGFKLCGRGFSGSEKSGNCRVFQHQSLNVFNLVSLTSWCFL